MDTWIRNEWSVSNSEYESSAQGKVYLVGAGPGDPDLITVKGLRCLRTADVVLYDRLISQELLDEARPGATRVFVGKGPACHALEQTMINELLIAYARQNCVVVRLKGGDPFIFGRGGEEAEALAQAKIPFEIVPGISAAVAVPAYAGIPVTHRDHASAVTIVTGHDGHKQPSQRLNWEALAKLGGTLVVLMGVKALPNFTNRWQISLSAPWKQVSVHLPPPSSAASSICARRSAGMRTYASSKTSLPMLWPVCNINKPI